jgi:hypothetical protein
MGSAFGVNARGFTKGMPEASTSSNTFESKKHTCVACVKRRRRVRPWINTPPLKLIVRTDHLNFDFSCSLYFLGYMYAPHKSQRQRSSKLA